MKPMQNGWKGYWKLETRNSELIMTFIPIIIFTLLLSFVPFSVALSSSIYRCIEWKEAFRIAIVFAIFHAGMVALGWVIGYSIKGLLNEMAVPVSAIIIFIIGMRIFLDSRRLGRENRTMAVEDKRILFGFALVTGINIALTGMGLGILYPGVFFFAGFVFAFVFMMTILGIRAGKRGMMNLGRTLEMLSGVSLMIISMVIVLQYLKIL